MKITRPHNQATVGNDFTVRVRVRAATGHFLLRLFVDGQLRASITGKRTPSSIRTAQLNLGAPGAHRVRALLTSRGHRASSSITVNQLEQGNGTPNPPRALENFKPIFYENFSTPAARGTMGSRRDPMKVIYSGSNNTRWVTYPNTFRDTYNNRRYRSDRVLSVHDGYLDFFLHRVNGKPAGANPSPLISGNQQYQTYGRYSARLKVENTNLSEYYIAWLLWPREDSDWQSAESDYPEGSLRPGRNGVYAYSQYGPGKTEPFGDPTIDMHEWHTYTQDWTPTQRRYYVDDKLIGVTTTPIFKRPQRWQLQIETKGHGNHHGHVLVDWAAVYSL